jgi:hypothetical protein
MGVVAELVEEAGVPGKTNLGRLLEDLVWQRIAPFVNKGHSPPPFLRLIAERLGFVIDGPEPRHR